TLNFDAGTNIVKVVFGCAGWSSPNSDTLAVNGGAAKTPTQGGVEATVEAVEFAIEASDSISIVTTKRIIFNYISVYIADVA
ncbi:MAG TPA: hypothetical protein PLX93_04305, partial [Bacilli bacterium]|nr:hypothetical protein [Bacilli bacterium]